MASLAKQLTTPKLSFEEFVSLTQNLIVYNENMISGKRIKNGYAILFAEYERTKRYLRPINQALFIESLQDFNKKVSRFEKLLAKLKKYPNHEFKDQDVHLVNSVIYTIQQNIGCGMDLLIEANSARKHTGNRFEELIKSVFDLIGFGNSRLVLQIPYKSEEGSDKSYKCEIDLVVSRKPKLNSNPKTLDSNELVVSVKTSSKDRMGKMFMDKLLLEGFSNQKQKIIGIFLNDVQRKGADSISFTLVSGLFMVYNQFLTELDGIYYIDPPPNTEKPPLNKHVKSFGQLLLRDLNRLLPVS